jgi:predicted ribosome quality control (RQC) complex YloA/Tae2 family protein
MPAPEHPTDALVAELSALAGARIQRVDVVAERVVILEVRVPGRTLHLMVSARPDDGLLALVPRRPPREVPGGQLQAVLRSRLLGQPLLRLQRLERGVALDSRQARVEVRLGPGRGGFVIAPPAADLPPPPSAEAMDAAEINRGPFPLAEAAGARYAARAPELLHARRVRALSQAWTAERKRLSRLVAKVAADRERLASLEDAEHEGELLKAVMSTLQRGQAAVEVFDWRAGAPRTLALDPALGPKENLARRFARAKKGKRGLPKVEARLTRARAALADVEARLSSLPAADDAALEAWLEAGGRAAAQAKEVVAPAGRPHPLDRWSRRFVAADGAELRVGKGAEANDRLTFGGAKGHDVWLHARGTTGAHVILRVEKGKTPSPEALLDAAHLAAHYSSARTEAKVEVIYAEARYVKKTKGAPAGQVGVSRSKTLLVRMDPARLARLLGHDEP